MTKQSNKGGQMYLVYLGDALRKILLDRYLVKQQHRPQTPNSIATAVDTVDGIVSNNSSTSSTQAANEFGLVADSLTDKAERRTSNGSLLSRSNSFSANYLTDYHSFAVGGEAGEETLGTSLYGPKNTKKLLSTIQQQPATAPTIPTHGPGAKMLNRADMTLLAVQCHLDREGASNMVVELIMSNPSYSIFVESVELGIALLEGGNSMIQNSIYHKLKQGNNSEKFFKVFYDKMKFAQQEIKSTISVSSSDFHKTGFTNDNEISTPMLMGQIEENGTLDNSTAAPNNPLFSNLVTKRLTLRQSHQSKVPKLPSEIAVMRQILRFLQLLCENHNSDLQNFLRSQTIKNNFNLVSETLIFLDRICGSTTGGLGLLGLYINESNVALVNQTLETLTEYCQGPCHENQNCIATHESNGIDIIIALILNDINPLGKKRMDLVLELKNNASKLLLAILESRTDAENSERIMYNMTPKQLIEVACNAFHQKVVPPMPEPEIVPVRLPTQTLIDDTVPPTIEPVPDPVSRKPAELVNPKEVGHNIYILSHQLAQVNKELADILKNPNKVDLMFDQSAKIKEALTYYQSHTFQIEIVRTDRTMEPIVFPVPPICEFLTSESKMKVYYTAERDEQGSKVSDFFERNDDLFGEMNWQKKLRGQPLLYWVSRHMSLWNSFSFYLAFVVNLIVAFFYPFPNKAATIDSRLSAAIWAIFLFSFASLLSFPGKLGIRVLIASTILRLIFSIDIQPTLWLLGTTQVFIKAIHLISIMGNHGTFNKSVRKILTDREFLYHIGYLACCVIGLCWHPFCYSILLLNVVYQEETLKNVIRSVTRNGRSIILTALLALILVYLFSIFGYLFFRDDFLLEVDANGSSKQIGDSSEEAPPISFDLPASMLQANETVVNRTSEQQSNPYMFCNKENCTETEGAHQSVLMDMVNSAHNNKPVPMNIRTSSNTQHQQPEASSTADEDDEPEESKERACDSLIMCIITTLNHGLRNGGGIGDVLRSPSSNESLFVARVIYDLLFFFVVIIIILNLIFGVIIDTFADLRSEKQQKEEILKNTCFICAFDNKSVSFEEHIRTQHNMWHYLYFIVHVKVKDPTEFTGPESYVASMIKERNLDWFPRMRAMSLAAEDSGDEQSELRTFQYALNDAVVMIKDLSQQLGELKEQMMEQRKQQHRKGILNSNISTITNPDR